MSYKVVSTEKFEKSFLKLDKSVQRLISKWIGKNLFDCENPYFSGKSLKGNLSRYWRYRVGDYRLIVDIVDDELIIVMVSVVHRKNIYD